MTDPEFKDTVIGFMARIDEHMANQNARCNSHATDIKELQDASAKIPAVENNIWWIDRWVAASWGAILGIVGFLAYMSGGSPGSKGAQ
jgi:hypothetical protein